jgi:hypothetical protein
MFFNFSVPFWHAVALQGLSTCLQRYYSEPAEYTPVPSWPVIGRTLPFLGPDVLLSSMYSKCINPPLSYGHWRQYLVLCVARLRQDMWLELSSGRKISHTCRQQKQDRRVYRIHGHASRSDAGGALGWAEAGATFCTYFNQDAFF